MHSTPAPDDYITKPFSIDEFLARLRVALRRSQTEGAAGEESSVYVNGRLKIDYAAGCVYIGDTEIHLTPDRIQAAVSAGTEYGEGAHPQFHPSGGVGAASWNRIFRHCGSLWQRCAKRSSRIPPHRSIFRRISASAIA